MAGVSGVNLIELTVVTIVLSILAITGVFQSMRAMERGQAAEATHYLAVLRSAQMRYRANNSAGDYTNLLSNLDVELQASLPRWGAPTLSGPAATGLATLTRSAGTYAGQTLGISYTSGTLCGTFAPLQSLPGCVAD